MRKALLLTSIALCLSAQAPAQTPTPAPASAPTPAAPTVQVEAPKFLPEELTGRELRDLSGRAFRLGDLRGRVYVINVWATWCGPCRLEIPGLNKVYEDYRARGVEFIGLTTEDPEEDADTVRKFVNELGMTYRIVWGDRETLLKLFTWSASQQQPPSSRGTVIPQTFVVAADGRLVLRVRGYNPRVPEMIRAGVRKALDLAPASPPATSGAAVSP